jgi:hypothetical protein
LYICGVTDRLLKEIIGNPFELVELSLESSKGFFHFKTLDRMNKEVSIYEYMKDWFDFCFENPESINPNHSALYFFILSHSNRLGWKNKFGLPTTMSMEAIGIKSYNTYIKCFNDLCSFGCIEVIERSKNQYSSNIIALSKFDKAFDKALDKATIKHVTKQGESTEQSNSSIIILNTNTLINKDTITPPTPKGESIDFDAFLIFYNQTFGKKATIISVATRKKYNSILKQGYTKDNISKAMVACAKDTFHIENNYKYCSLDYFTRVKTIDMHGFEAPTVKPVNIGVTMAELNNPNLDV